MSLVVSCDRYLQVTNYWTRLKCYLLVRLVPLSLSTLYQSSDSEICKYNTYQNTYEVTGPSSLDINCARIFLDHRVF